MTKPKYQIGDIFDVWVVIKVDYALDQIIYLLHNPLNNSYLTLNEQGLIKLLVEKSAVVSIVLGSRDQ